MERCTKQKGCMDSKPVGAAGGGGGGGGGGGASESDPASGVKVFTVFVLSGSLFLLIYNVGRKRMSARSSHLGRETNSGSSSLISNPSSLIRGYFSHLKDKPVARHRKPSLTAALDASSSTSYVEENVSSSDNNNNTDNATALVSDDTTGFVKNMSSSTTPRGSFSRSYDAETGPYMVTRSYSSASQPSCSNAEPSSSTTGHEGEMVEHMRRTSRFNESRATIDFDPQRKRSSSSFLGDMSQLETSAWSLMTSKSIPPAIPNVAVKADVPTDDPYGQRASPIQRGATMSREQFLKPLIYILIWFALSYSCHVYSSTRWGAKMAKFPAPFLKATVLFLVQAIMSSCMLRWPRNNVFVMPWNTYTLIVAPIATAAALDRDLQDASVYMFTVGMPTLNKPTGFLDHAYMMFSSFREATVETVWDARMQSKGYVPLCLFLFALAFRLESRSIAIAVSVAVIAVGFILGVSNGTNLGVVSLKERSFGPLLTGFRWAAIQILLQKRELGLVTPVVTMRALSPSMAMVAALLSASTEHWSSLFTLVDYFDNPEQALMSCAHIVIGALLGTALALAELVVVYHTSALTLITLGMVKDFCVVVPRLIHNSQFSEQNIFGIFIFSIGVGSLIWLKYKKLVKTNRLEAPGVVPPAPEIQPEAPPGPSVDRWPRFRARDFTIIVSQADQHMRHYVGRAQDVGTKVSRKLRALWELAS
ncbi:unnamed protein product [Calypogeia fissa]